MNCIKNDLIQKYIDGEASAEELLLVEDHISNCVACAKKLEDRERLANKMRTTLNLLDEAEVDIPPFIVPENPNQRKKSIFNKYFLAVSAASILIFVLFMVQKDGHSSAEEIILVNSFESGFDANRTISQQEMVINIIDANGKVSEFYIE